MHTAAAHLAGTYNGSLNTAGNTTNWFDPANGKVPAGYGNSNGPNNIPVEMNVTEFGADDGINLVTLDFHHDGHTTLRIYVTPPATAVLTGYSPAIYTIRIKSDTFKRYKAIKKHEYNMTTRPDASFSGDTLTIQTYPQTAVTVPTMLQAEWHLYVSPVAQTTWCSRDHRATSSITLATAALTCLSLHATLAAPCMQCCSIAKCTAWCERGPMEEDTCTGTGYMVAVAVAGGTPAHSL